jgi:hypothetical protein
MTQKNRFLLQNNLPKRLILSFEPEADEFQLSPGEEVTLHDSFDKEPLTVKIVMLNDGELVLSIWPGDGTVSVEKGGLIVR